MRILLFKNNQKNAFHLSKCNLETVLINGKQFLIKEKSIPQSLSHHIQSVPEEWCGNLQTVRFPEEQKSQAGKEILFP